MTTNALILMMVLASAFTCAVGARKHGMEKASFDDAEAFFHDPFSGAIGSDTLGAALGQARGRRFSGGGGLGAGVGVGGGGLGFGGGVIIGGRGAAAGVGGGFGAGLP